MPPANRGRPASLIALLVMAIVTGAFAGLIASCFIWLIEEGATLPSSSISSSTSALTS
jgi:hypothetical protein